MRRNEILNLIFAKLYSSCWKACGNRGSQIHRFSFRLLQNLDMLVAFNLIVIRIASLIFVPSALCVVFVHTSLGPIKGTVMMSRNGKKFNAFMSVPYAKPPVRELRLRDPQPPEPWSGVLDGTKYPPRCPQCDGQVGYKGDEDCLYLNVYVPQLTEKEKSTLPVWVFIYGGRRIAGHVAPYKHGPHYIMDKPVIFITMTYRLGPLGFLSTEDNVIPGNYGLKDETMVLRWIRDHIHSFGGDASNVTISGGSSGAIDVGLHLVSPLSKGLFHRAISQSGHPLLTIMKPGTARKTAWDFARLVGCYHNITKSEQLLQCLQNVPPKILLQEWSYSRTDYIFPKLSFGTVIEPKNVDGSFLTGNPYYEIRKSSSIPFMLGINRNEGTIGTAGIFSNKKILNHFTQNSKRLLPIQLQYQHSPNKDYITDLILEKYFKNKPLNESFYGLADIFSLSFFISGGIETALKYNGVKYFYLYEHENKVNYVRNYFLRGVITKHKTGVAHGEELRSLQHYPMLLPPVMDGEDRLVSEQLISLWYNFVDHGNPNSREEEQLWKPATTSDIEYLHIFNGSLVMRKRPLWNDFIFSKNLGHPFFGTINYIP